MTNQTNPVTEIDNVEFETNVLNDTEGKVFVAKFYADWCGPCKTAKGILDKISIDYPNINFVSVNAGEYPEVADLYSVSSLPTLVMIKDGEMLAKYTSGVNTPSITNWLSTAMIK